MWVQAQTVRNKDGSTGTYLHLVQSRRVNGKVRQEIISTLGRLDVLPGSGTLEIVRKHFFDAFLENFVRKKSENLLKN
jgi:hypothetical protein